MVKATYPMPGSLSKLVVLVLVFVKGKTLKENNMNNVMYNLAYKLHSQ